MPQAAGAGAVQEQEPQLVEPPHLAVLEGGVSRAPDAPRRTVKITGQPTPARRQTRSRTATQVQARPDRIVLWAFMLGLFLVFMAAATAQASPV